MDGFFGRFAVPNQRPEAGRPIHRGDGGRMIAVGRARGMERVIATGAIGLVTVVTATSGLGIRDAGFAFITAMAIAGWCYVAVSSFRRARENEGVENEDLLRRVEAAEAATKAKSRYLANVSHEIRSPLNAIYGYAQLIERSDQDGARDSARVIRRSAEHLTSLVEGLLDISQLENGVIRIKSDSVNLREFVEQICWMMRPDASSKGLELKVELPPFLPELVRMDQSRLRQVVINLLSNAIKFTNRGAVTLRLKYANQIAVFEIEDTGQGISDADQARIFVPFDRGSCEERKRKPGAGLGLSITRSIVEILGGQLELESEPGKGSCFRVTLMLGGVSGTLRNASAKAAPSMMPPPVSGYQGRTRSILLVDDDIQQLSFMRALLDALGFAVTAVPDGETAVSLGRELAFDLAILDISLPGISGWDTAAQLHEAQPEGLRIMMLSANVQEYHRPETLKPVHDLFLVKPVEFNGLLEALAGLLELTWKHADPVAVPVRSGGAGRLGPEAEPYLSRIREFLAIGHYRGVERALAELADNVPEAGDLVRQLLESLDRFDLSGMARKLEDC